MHTRPTSFQSSGQMSLVQLATSDQDTVEFLSGPRAFREKAIRVQEINSGGDVNLLLAVNRSASYVLLIDGDVLEGAMQTRVLNTSVLLAPHSKTKIPVSCVERGRWSSVSPEFSGSDYTAPSDIRAMKVAGVHRSLRQNLGHVADQGRVWQCVGRAQARYGIRSETDSMADLFQAKRDDFTRMIESFSPDPGANGMAVFRGPSLQSIDLFNRRDVFSDYFQHLLRGSAANFVAAGTSQKPVSEHEAFFHTMELLDHIDSLECKAYPAVGAGREERFQSAQCAGFRLLLDREFIHLATFPVLEAGRE
jgi:hypothetical protein